MRIGFFVENSRKGGYDTFVINLAIHWPFHEDELVLFCNASHPGLETIRNRAGQHLRIVAYDALTVPEIVRRLRGLPKPLMFIVKVAFFFFGFPYLILSVGRMLARERLDRCLVINGGYPGGDACLAATVAWGLLRPDRKAWHNFHNFAVEVGRQKFAVRLRANAIDALVGRYAAGFVSVSKACAKSLSNRPRLAMHQARIIFNGLADLHCVIERDVRAELGIPANTRLLLMLATYEPRKGHDFIIRAMARVVKSVPSAHLLICGHGLPAEMQYVGHLREQSPARDRIHLQGYRADVGNLLAQADVLAIPSQSFESFGYTAVEAMACRVPVVATNTGGLPEVVEDGVTGYVVPSVDEELFADSIVRLLTDAVLRQQLGANGEARFKGQFGAERMAREYVDLIRTSYPGPGNVAS